MSVQNDDENIPWFDDYVEDESDTQIDEYDLTATPNDFNITTIFNFIQSGAVVIPGFQRNYVWDRPRASKLIESLLLGLPVPQIFLYEEARNKFLVIDGQQRLMSIYYFMKQRFPRKEKRAELRLIFEREGKIPDEILHDDNFFSNFSLQLPAKLPDQPNKFHGKKYSTLGDHSTQFDLRPIRNVIVKQASPEDDDSAVYEIFSRLNSGGINLRPQEIRLSLYHSKFYEMLLQINGDDRWRRLLQSESPDLHMKDIEILLRSFGLLIDLDNYSPSMVRFLNKFSKKGQTHTDDQNKYLRELFDSFLESTRDLTDTIFINPGNKRFNIALFEATFSAACRERFSKNELPHGELNEQEVKQLASDNDFISASQKATTQTSNVKARLERAREIVSAI